MTVTWCIGHLVEAAAPEAYDAQLKRWSIEQLPIIPERWRVEVKTQTAAQFKVVKALVAKATHLIIATDADREGELIAREIIDLCGYRGPIERLWLSALNDASIRAALDKLRPSAETLPLYHAALARSRADWLVGMNLSRLFTLLGRKAGYNGVLSVGRVQTPTLKLVVDRDREIAGFIAVPYWAIDVDLSANGQSFSAQWLAPKASAYETGHCLQQAIAQQATQKIRNTGHANVISVETERIREAPPLPFDLGSLQETCLNRPGYRGGSNFYENGAMKKTATSNKFFPEVRERAVRLMQEHRGEYPSLWAAATSIAPKIGCAPHSLMKWVQRHEIDSGTRAGVSSEERERIKALERENKELRRANEILRTATALFSPRRRRAAT